MEQSDHIDFFQKLNLLAVKRNNHSGSPAAGGQLESREEGHQHWGAEAPLQ